MPRFQQRDFYFGAALSMFLRYNSDSRPTLFENIDKTTRLIKMTTSTSDDFYVFMKYTIRQKNCVHKYTSWNFQFSEKDKEVIQTFNSPNTPLYIFFICGIDGNTGEVAILKYDEYLLIEHKTSVTINKENKCDKHFNIHYAKSKKDTLPLATNRITKKITLL